MTHADRDKAVKHLVDYSQLLILESKKLEILDIDIENAILKLTHEILDLAEELQKICIFED